MTRQGLLIESSRTELGRRWFARLKIQRFDHVHKNTLGSRSRSESILGVEFVVRRGPEIALENAKIVAGYIVVFMSLRVIR
jgi:hypothetical protein